MAENEEEVIRFSALLRGTESAWQAVSYGLTSIPFFGEVGAIYINFGLWALGLFPAWLVLRHWGSQATEDAEIVGRRDGSSSSLEVEKTAKAAHHEQESKAAEA